MLTRATAPETVILGVARSESAKGKVPSRKLSTMFVKKILRTMLTTADGTTEEAGHVSLPASCAVAEVGPSLGTQENKWRGGVLSPSDACLYCVPCNAARVLRFDPAHPAAASLVGPDLGDGRYKWSGGVGAHDGRVYGVPCSARRVLRVDPREGTAELVGGDLGEGRMKWISGALNERDGCIYCMPYDARRILRFDPRTEESALVGDDLGPGYKYSATVFVTSSDDRAAACLVGIPFNARRVVRYCPVSDTTSYVDDDVGAASAKWCGGVRGADGRVYGVPNFSDRVLRVETTLAPAGGDNGDGGAGTVGRRLPGCTGKWYGGAAGEDGRLYFAPSCAGRVLRFDPADPRSAAPLGPHLGRDYYKWSGAVLADDGSVYCVPASSSRVLRIDTRTTIDHVHRLLRMGMWGGVRRLLREGAADGEATRRALGRRGADGGRSALGTALGLQAPLNVVVEIVKGNYNVLVEKDYETGLYPFMLAAVGDAANLDCVYELLRFRPALNEFR